MDRRKKLLIGIGATGIAIELVAIALLAARRIDTPIAMPLIVVGMFLALVPLFALSRRRR